MRTKRWLVLAAAVLIPAYFWASRPRNPLCVPSDLRDALNDNGFDDAAARLIGAGEKACADPAAREAGHKALGQNLDAIARDVQAALERSDLGFESPPWIRLSAQWAQIPACVRDAALEQQARQVEQDFALLAALKAGGVDLSKLPPKTRALIFDGGRVGPVGQSIIAGRTSPLVVQGLVRVSDDLVRDPQAAAAKLNAMFENDPAARQTSSLAVTAAAGGGTGSPAGAANPAPARGLRVSDVPNLEAAEASAETFAVNRQQSAFRLSAESLRYASQVAFSEAKQAVLGPQEPTAWEVRQALQEQGRRLPAKDPRRAELSKQYQAATVVACMKGQIPPGLTFKGSDFGMNPESKVTCDGGGVTSYDPKNPDRWTYERFDGKMLVEQLPMAGGKPVMAVSQLDGKGRVLKERLLDDGTKAHHGLLNDKGELVGVVLDDYKKPNFAALRSVGFVQESDNAAIKALQMPNELPRLAGQVSESPRLLRLPPSNPNFPGDLALAYKVGNTEHLLTIRSYGLGYAISDATLNAQNGVDKIERCQTASEATDACAHRTEFTHVGGVGIYDHDKKQMTYQNRVQILRDGVNDQAQELKGDSASSIFFHGMAKKVGDNAVMKVLGFIGDRGQDFGYQTEAAYMQFLATRRDNPQDKEVRLSIDSIVTNWQQPVQCQVDSQCGAHVLADLRKYLDTVKLPGQRESSNRGIVYDRFHDMESQKYCQFLLKTAADPQLAQELDEGRYRPNDEELGRFIIGGGAGLGFSGIPQASAEAAAQANSNWAKFGYHTLGFSATFAKYGTQNILFEVGGFALGPLSKLGTAAEEINHVVPVARQAAETLATAEKATLLTRTLALGGKSLNYGQKAYFGIQVPLGAAATLSDALQSDDPVKRSVAYYEAATAGVFGAQPVMEFTGALFRSRRAALPPLLGEAGLPRTSEPGAVLPVVAEPRILEPAALPGQIGAIRPHDAPLHSAHDIAFMEAFQHEEYQKLVKEHPEYQVFVEDAKFEGWDKLSRDEIDAQIRARYGNGWEEHNKGYDDYNAYLRRQRWRAEAGGRPIPGDPGGPPKSEVDNFLGPKLPPADGSGIVHVVGSGPEAKTYVTTKDGVDVYGVDGKRLGSLPFSISPDGTLHVGHELVDPSARRQGLGTEMMAQMLGNHPEVTRIETMLSEDNAHAFWTAYEQTHDYASAIKATPAYKARARQGFTEIAPPPADWQSSGGFVPYESGKPATAQKTSLPEVEASARQDLVRGLQSRGDAATQRTLERVLDTDPMTGLPNRAALERQAPALAARLQDPAVAMLDMNNFGAVNNGLAAVHGPTRGKILGDGVLASAGPRLQLAARQANVTLGRFGGEEFVVIGEKADVLKFVQRTRAEFADGQVLKDAGFGPRTEEHGAFRKAAAEKGRGGQSMGDFTAGVASLKGRSFTEALKVADSALGKAKDTGHRGSALIDEEGDLRPMGPLPRGAKPTPSVAPAPGTAALLHDMAQLKSSLTEHEYAKFQEIAFRDGLTNTRTFDYLHLKAAEWSVAYPEGMPTSLVSVRNLKLINDALGHDVGDFYLQTLGQTLRAEVNRARNSGMDVQEPVRVASKEFLLVGRDAPQVSQVIAQAMQAKIVEGNLFTPEEAARMRDYGRQAEGVSPGLSGGLRVVASRRGGRDVFADLDGRVAQMENLKAAEAKAPGKGSLSGDPARINPSESPENRIALQRQNEAAEALSRHGYHVYQNGLKSGADYLVNGVAHDCYSPTTKSPRSIWDTLSKKSAKDQAHNFVLNLDGSPVELSALRLQLASFPIPGLGDVLAVRGGQVFPLMRSGSPVSGPR